MAAREAKAMTTSKHWIIQGSTQGSTVGQTYKLPVKHVQPRTWVVEKDRALVDGIWVGPYSLVKIHRYTGHGYVISAGDSLTLTWDRWCRWMFDDLDVSAAAALLKSKAPSQYSLMRSRYSDGGPCDIIHFVERQEAQVVADMVGERLGNRNL